MLELLLGSCSQKESYLWLTYIIYLQPVLQESYVHIRSVQLFTVYCSILKHYASTDLAGLTLNFSVFNKNDTLEIVIRPENLFYLVRLF